MPVISYDGSPLDSCYAIEGVPAAVGPALSSPWGIDRFLKMPVWDVRGIGYLGDRSDVRPVKSSRLLLGIG